MPPWRQNSRLLEEIHIALLRSIIKDIEDVARTPTNALVGNLSSAFTPSGGHPQIVEGVCFMCFFCLLLSDVNSCNHLISSILPQACAWGFNLLSWKHHLTPSTWPEVLRQFALSAGFGPKLKRDVETACLRDSNGVWLLQLADDWFLRFALLSWFMHIFVHIRKHSLCDIIYAWSTYIFTWNYYISFFKSYWYLWLSSATKTSFPII